MADPEAHAQSVGKLAHALGWPVLADGLSALRNHASKVPHLVVRYDAILRSPEAASALRPEFILCLGEWPTSKVLRVWIESAAVPVFIVSERPDNRDALHGATRRGSFPLQALVDSLPGSRPEHPYERLWAGFERRASGALDARLESAEDLVEPKAAWLLARHLPARHKPLRGEQHARSRHGVRLAGQ